MRNRLWEWVPIVVLLLFGQLLWFGISQGLTGLLAPLP